MINDDVVVYCEKNNVTIRQQKQNMMIEGDGFYLEVFGEASTSLEALLNTPGFVEFCVDVDKSIKSGFSVASTLSLMAKAKILFA